MQTLLDMPALLYGVAPELMSLVDLDRYVSHQDRSQDSGRAELQLFLWHTSS
jgi:hypothetical protein